MATKGTRKRPKQTDPNPLFCQWLREWRDEAEAKGWKTKFTYAMVKYLHSYIHSTRSYIFEIYSNIYMYMGCIFY